MSGDFQFLRKDLQKMYIPQLPMLTAIIMVASENVYDARGAAREAFDIVDAVFQELQEREMIYDIAETED